MKFLSPFALSVRIFLSLCSVLFGLQPSRTIKSNNRISISERAYPQSRRPWEISLLNMRSFFPETSLILYSHVNILCYSQVSCYFHQLFPHYQCFLYTIIKSKLFILFHFHIWKKKLYHVVSPNSAKTNVTLKYLRSSKAFLYSGMSFLEDEAVISL